MKFLLFSIERANKINRRFLWIGKFLSKIFFNTKYDLQKTEYGISAENYLTASFFSAMVYGLIFFLLLFGLTFTKDFIITPENSILSGIIGFFFFIIFLLLHSIYPGIMAKNIAMQTDQSLIFALKSMQIQVTSGVSLYDAMVNVSKSGYGPVSEEFGHVVKDISAGSSETKALEKLAVKTKSDYLKKTSWQLISSIRSGASMQGALNGVVLTLNNYQIRAIKNYAGELNMWILIYLLMAAAVPTLGITFLVILSTLGGASIGPEIVILTVLAAFALQIVLIGFVKTRIPKGYI